MFSSHCFPFFVLRPHESRVIKIQKDKHHFRPIVDFSGKHFIFLAKIYDFLLLFIINLYNIGEDIDISFIELDCVNNVKCTWRHFLNEFWELIWYIYISIAIVSYLIFLFVFCRIKKFQLIFGTKLKWNSKEKRSCNQVQVIISHFDKTFFSY